MIAGTTFHDIDFKEVSYTRPRFYARILTGYAWTVITSHTAFIRSFAMSMPPPDEYRHDAPLFLVNIS